MIKRTAIVFAGIFVLFMLYLLLQSFMGSSPAPVIHTKERAPKARAWNGKNAHLYNITFNQRHQQLTMEQASFSDLQYPQATAVVDLAVPAPGGKEPAWLKGKRVFFGYQPLAARYFTPKIKVTPQGAVYKVRLIFTKIPTSSLGPTCASANFTSNNPLSLNFPGMAGPNFAVVISASPAPPGHCLNEPQAVAARAARNDVRLQSIRAKKKTVLVSGGVSKPGIHVVRVRVAPVAHPKALRTVAKARLRNHHFKASFKLKPGGYLVLVGYGSHYPPSGSGRVVVRGSGAAKKHH